ncbi:hypothetical protein K8089_04455 [Aequorivita sp. F47161]|uniref:Uncharacterized protein n=1 Tax=Aequorivita vitellina TaxID=2874475 RepID=A0A9X1TZL8_9FLAO|nr:hypothetical protein [Aequorivita vitellina]MCG2418264.1 hypothetical protein [Aequorivita vitellina]
MTEQQESFLSNTTAIISLIIGGLGFISAIGTLIFTTRNNNRNYKLQDDKNEREKSKAYNRVLGNFLKVYHSYIKHKHLLNENGIENIPDSALEQIIEKIDNFEHEIKKFRIVIDNESEIIPELTIQLHEIMDLLGRFEIMSEQFKNNALDLNLQKNKLVLKRAFVFSIKDLLDDYFEDLINDLSKKAEISNEFKDHLAEFNSDETIGRNIKLQQKLTERMLVSLSKQLGREVTIKELFN